MDTNSTMKTLYLERSVSNGRNGSWVEELELTAVDRIVIGMGPGSFAGIRSVLAFAQGYALGRASCEVLGLPSPCAIAGAYYAASPTAVHRPLAVIGDARRGMCWIALFNGYALLREIFQVKAEELLAAVGDEFAVVSPDAARLDERLKAAFGERYLGYREPTSEGLRLFAEANPSMLKPDPLPIYLNPAVRD